MKQFVVCSALFGFCTSAVALFEHDRAIAALQRGNAEKALSYLTHELVKSPESAEVLYDSGVASYRAGSYENAQAYFDTVARLQTASAALKEKAYFNAGNTAVARKKLEDAVAHYEQALALNKDNAQAVHNLAKVKEMLKQQQEQQQQDQKNNNQEDNNDQSEKQSGDQQQDDKKSGDKQGKDQQKNEQQSEQQSGADQQQKNGNQGDQSKKDGKQQQTGDKKEQPERGADDQHGDDQKKTDGVDKQSPQPNGNNDRKKNERADKGLQHKQEKNDGDKSGKHKQDSAQEKQQSAAQKDTQKSDKAPGEKMNAAASHKEGKQPAWLEKLLDEQEKKEGQYAKQLIKIQVDNQHEGNKNDEQHNW